MPCQRRGCHKRALRGLLISRQVEFEARASIRFAANGNAAVVQIEDALDDRKSQARGTRVLAVAIFAVIEAVEYFVEFGFRNPAAVIADRDGDRFRAPRDLDTDVTALRRELNGIFDEIFQHSLDQTDICIDGGGYVHISSGIHGIGNLQPASYDWRNPVARIKISAVR